MGTPGQASVQKEGGAAPRVALEPDSSSGYGVQGWGLHF